MLCCEYREKLKRFEQVIVKREMLESYKKEAKFTYDVSKYGFGKMMQNLLECEDLSLLHETLEKQYDFFDSPLIDSRTVFHKAVYDKLRSGWPEFLAAYRDFITHEIFPTIQTDQGLIYQKWPTFRFHLPNNVAVGGWHSDQSYNHPPGEINFILPLTPMFESNATIAESEPGKKDFHQIECIPGEFVRFNGNECLHGNLPNRTGVTRVSFDFRIMRLEEYNPGSGRASLVMGKEYLIGGYYERL